MLRRALVFAACWFAAALAVAAGDFSDDGNERKCLTDAGERWDSVGCCVKFASYNVGLTRPKAGDLIEELKTGTAEQIKNIAEIIQRGGGGGKAPDVLGLFGFDWDEKGQACELLRKNYLNVAQHSADRGNSEPVDYKYCMHFANNAAVPSTVDLDGDGQPGDPYAPGNFPGQAGFAVLTKSLVIKADDVRSFQKFLWKDMPIPDWPEGVYTDEQKKGLRVLSHNLVDVAVGSPCEGDIRLVMAHLTDPALDGESDKTTFASRNAAEMRLLNDYLQGVGYLVDDAGLTGGMADKNVFVAMGTLNSDPVRGQSKAITMIYNNARVNQRITNGDKKPSSNGAEQWEFEHKNDASEKKYDKLSLKQVKGTQTSLGGLRADYLLPSERVGVQRSGVFWPGWDDDYSDLVAKGVSSDHLMVWADLFVPRQRQPSYLDKLPWYGTVTIFLSVFSAMGLCAAWGWRTIKRKQQEAIEAEEELDRYNELDRRSIF